jgi:preprotein translocase subunit SecG
MTTLYFIALSLFFFLSLFLCMVILAQESKSSGLGSSFGGDSSSSVFGTSTALVLKKFTAYLIVAFMLTSLVISLWTSAMTA